MKTFTEKELRKLVDLIDESYRGVTRNNTNGSEILENFLKNGFEEVVEEESIPFSYSFLRRKLEWEDFCKLTGVDYYATRNGFEIKDTEIFNITESKAKQFNLI